MNSHIFVSYTYSFGIETIKTFIHSRSSLKTNPIPGQNGQSFYPFLDQNDAKTIPDGAAHTYIAYTREYPPPPLGLGSKGEGPFYSLPKNLTIEIVFSLDQGHPTSIFGKYLF